MPVTPSGDHVPNGAFRAVRARQSRAEVVAALGSPPSLEVLLQHAAEGGLKSARWPVLDPAGAPGWLYVSFDREDRVLGHAIVPRAM
jgi:hypothetical protein